MIVNEAARLVGTHGAYIRLLEDGALVANVATASAADYVADAASRFPGFKVEEGTSAFGHAMAIQKPVVIEDTQNSKWVKDAMRAIQTKHGIHGCVLVLLLANDTSIGVLTVLDTRVRLLTDDEVSLLTAFADQAVLALEKARFLNEAESRERQATQLHEVTAQLASTTDMDSILELITEKAKELLGSDTCGIGKYDEARGGLVMPAFAIVLPSAEQEHSGLMEDAVIRPEVGTSGKAYAEQRPVWSHDYLEDASFQQDLAVAEMVVEKLGLRTGMSVPIIIREEAYGVLHVMYRETHEFTEWEIQLLQ